MSSNIFPRPSKRSSGFDRFPTVTAAASYANERLSEAGFPGGQLSERDHASWELDFFGRVRRSIRGTQRGVEAAEASLRDVLVSLIARPSGAIITGAARGAICWSGTFAAFPQMIGVVEDEPWSR